MVRDHPRVCGEERTMWETQKPPVGSPPRMRGRGGAQRTTSHYKGITPAYAGKRALSYLKPTRRRDHPRVCGEEYNAVDMQADYLGSPPRMRGRALDNSDSPTFSGITPAYAGKRGWMRATEVTRKDHPRVCGEEGLARPQADPPQGSPPRMRGRAHDLFRQATKMGITPAYAGKSKGQVSGAITGQGSPPRMRGRVFRSAGAAFRAGITPAYAGKSAALNKE